MRNFFRLLIVAVLIAAGWMNRDKLKGIKGGSSTIDAEEPPPVVEAVAPSTPVPGATPHPAREAQATAGRIYPALLIPGSPFNKKFIALHTEAQRNEPDLLSQPDWPLKLAERTAKALGGGAMPIPTTPDPGRSSGLQGTVLDRKPKHP